MIAEKTNRSARSQRVRVLIGFQAIFALPLWLFLAVGLSLNHKLTFEAALVLALCCSAVACVVALLFWVTFLNPLRLRKLEQHKERNE
jgi:predicted permease